MATTRTREETVLIHEDPAVNMSRFYALSVDKDLFGVAMLVVRWGRRGRAGNLRIDASGSPREMSERMAKIVNRKVRKGYHPLPLPRPMAPRVALPLFPEDAAQARTPGTSIGMFEL